MVSGDWLGVLLGSVVWLVARVFGGLRGLGAVLCVLLFWCFAFWVVLWYFVFCGFGAFAFCWCFVTTVSALVCLDCGFDFCGSGVM